RHLGRQWYRSAEQRRGEEGHAVRRLAVETLIALDLNEGDAEGIVARSIGDIDASALRQGDVVEAKLQAAQRFGTSDGAEGSVGEHSEIGGCILEHPRVRVDPDAKRSRLAECHDGLARPGDRNDDVVAAAPRPRRRILLYSAEQHELFAGEV